MDKKVWLITGASRGMGMEFAKYALSQGHQVAAAARNAQTVEDALGSDENLFPVRLDVTDAQSITDAVAAVIEKFGRIDVLVNNAGYGIFGALEETTDEETRKIFDTNLFGPLNIIRAVLPAMRSQEFGRIVNVASMAGFAPDPGGALYDMTKAAVINLSGVLSQELACFGIQAMAICPGMIRTEFMGSKSMKVPENLIPEYAGTPARGALDYCLTHDGQQYGDPAKVAKVLFDVVNSESMPTVLPIGKDAVKKWMRTQQRNIDMVEPYTEMCSNTSFPRE